LEAAAAAGLVAGDPTGLLLPTTGFDRWAHAEPADRWQAVVDSWLQVPRRFAGASEPGGHALGPEAATTLPIADARALVLRLALDTGVGARLEPDGLLAALARQRPRLTRLPDLAVLVREIWWEAGLLGLVSLGAVSSYTDALLAGNGVVPDRLRRLFPGTQSDLVLQADLTAVAPGPLPTGTARELRLLADQESRGGGGVFRFSGGSLRRAFRAGWSAAEVHDWLISHSTTGVPQPLAYLVDDVARQVGQVRVGFAGSFVRVDDPVVAAALLAAPEAAGLGLREVVPGVLVSLSEPAEVATVLQTLGHTPAVEDESGQVLNLPPRRRAVARSREERPEPASAREAAAAALAGETGERAAGSASAEDTEAILAQLASATAAARAVRVGYVAADGAAYERDLAPLDLGSGAVRGIDRQTAAVVTIPLARISSVRAT
ncbi:MAG: helicase-associated domain-containing protein, partial [Actinomycetes bacterium]